MGCGSSRTIVSTLTWDTDLIDGRIRKRHGHPSTHRTDGYEFGIRVRVKGFCQSLYAGTSNSTNEKVSIKESNLNHYPQAMAIEEVMILAKLNHDSIIQIKEVFVAEGKIYSVLSYIEPTRLKDFVDIKARVTNLTIAEAKAITMAINQALIHCHDNKIVVRSITPDNIMVKKITSSANGHGSDNQALSTFDVKLVEFGYATENIYTNKGGLKNLSDHPLFEWNDVLYMPPEAILGHPFSTSLDMWSLGVLMFLMLSGELPFNSPDDKLLINAIKVSKLEFRLLQLF